MLRLTAAELRVSGRIAREAIEQYHPIKVTVALDCWAHTLGARSWSSLMAQVGEGRVQAIPSLSRLAEALAHRRKPVSRLVAADILTRAVVAGTGRAVLREKPASSARRLAQRKLVALAVAHMEKLRIFDWDYTMQLEVPSGNAVFPFPRAPEHEFHILWRDIGFGEMAVEAGISAPHTKVSLKEYTYTQRRWLAYVNFDVERQDGPFIQYLGGTGLVLKGAAQRLLSPIALPPPIERVYRFTEKVWM